MATTSYLYHALGLVRYQHLSTQYSGGAIYYHVSRKREQRRVRVVGLAGMNW